MTTFEIKAHKEIDVSFQGINLTEFSFKVDNKVDSDEIVDTFIRSNHYSFDSLSNCRKKEPEKPYLKQAFNVDYLKIADFKKSSKEEISQFLIDYLNEANWGDDRNEFAMLLDKYFEIHSQFSLENDFYIISKDWFAQEDERVIEPESYCYTYYFLIISVDRKLNLLTFTEWTYD